MNGFPILGIGIFWNLVAFLFIACCILLILIVLIQKGKGGGLSSAFGGGMASGILGSKTGDFLTWVTIVFVGIMLTLAVVLAKYYKPAPTGIPGASGCRWQRRKNWSALCCWFQSNRQGAGPCER